MDRDVPDVIKKTKEHQKRLHSAANSQPGMYTSAVVKTKRDINVVPVGGISENHAVVETTDEWSQEQQQLLEIGLKKYGKELSDRWVRIAGDVVGKDKVSLRIYVNTLSPVTF